MSSRVERYNETLDLRYTAIAVAAKESGSLFCPGAPDVLVRLCVSMRATACRLVDFGDCWVFKNSPCGLCCTKGTLGTVYA